MNLTLIPSGASTWAKILIVISLGKAFVAGAGLGLAALGIVDIGSTLGVKPLMEFVQKEYLLEAFAYGGGILSMVGQAGSIVWKIVTR